MKRSILILIPILAFFLFNGMSCDDNEPFVNVKAIETQIFNEIKSHRIANDIPAEDPFVHQFVMVKEAQLISAKLAYSSSGSGIDTTGISEHWEIIHNKIGGYNDLTLMQSTNETTAADIVANWTSDSTHNAMLLEDYTQCGVGVEYGPDELTYVTVLMMKADSPVTQ
jgi:hypothetical protein